jgi:hypothetical protein
MVEPERVLHSVMVIAFERKGEIDQDLKIIKAIQNELELGDEDKLDALEHIKKFRGDGDWSGKRDAVVSVAIDRIEEAIEDNIITSSSIINALKKLINVTLNEQKSSTDPLAAFEDEEEEEMQDSSLKFGLDEEEEEEEEDLLANQGSFSLGDSEEIEEEIDNDDVDPFDLIGGRENSNSRNGESGYKDPLEELMDEVDNDELQIGTLELGAFEDEDTEERDEISEKDSKSSDSQIIEMYRMMLDTVWVDDVIDPSEVALLARKRKDLDISFETHLKLVREMLEDSD